MSNQESTFEESGPTNTPRPGDRMVPFVRIEVEHPSQMVASAAPMIRKYVRDGLESDLNGNDLMIMSVEPTTDPVQRRRTGCTGGITMARSSSACSQSWPRRSTAEIGRYRSSLGRTHGSEPGSQWLQPVPQEELNPANGPRPPEVGRQMARKSIPRLKSRFLERSPLPIGRRTRIRFSESILAISAARGFSAANS